MTHGNAQRKIIMPHRLPVGKRNSHIIKNKIFTENNLKNNIVSGKIGMCGLRFVVYVASGIFLVRLINPLAPNHTPQIPNHTSHIHNSTLYPLAIIFSMYGQLVPIGGGDPIPLRKPEILVGRKDNCDIVLRFSNVSSQHCRLVLSGGYWYVLDMHSTNGIKLNGVKVTDHRVDPGATLAISKHLFKLQYDPAENGAVGPPPGEILHESDMLSQSLMERAGLQHPSIKKKKELGSTTPDLPTIAVIETPTTAMNSETKSEKKDFFSQLKFD
jgi:adenylate cyclase